MVRATSQTARFGTRGRDTVQHNCDLWWNFHGQGRASSGFPCWNRGCERSDAIPGVEEPMSTDGRQQFIPPLTPITIMRQLGANIRMKDSGDVLEIEDDQGTTHTEKLVRERSGHVHNQLDFFFREKVGKCQTACALSSSSIRSWPAIVMRNVRMGSTNSRTRNKRCLCRPPSVTVWMPWKP